VSGPLLSSLGLALLLGSAPAAAQQPFLVDGGLALSARSSVNAGRAELSPLLLLRGGYLAPLGGASGLLLGGDARLSLETLPRVRGTSDVGSLSWELALEPRALVGWQLGDGPLALVPYAFAGVLVGGRVADVYVFGEHHFRGQATYGASVGAGASLRLGVVSVSLELGGGLREDGPALATALLAGFAF
jgi:hypothetical protein